jgi:hypothetical protein
MSITTHADPETGWLHVRILGEVRSAELAAHLKEVAGQGLNHAPRLVDTRGSTFAVSAEEWLHIAVLVRQLQITYGIWRMAIVAPDAEAYENVRSHPGFAAGPDSPVELFRDPESAAAWLRGPGVADAAP